AKPACQDAKAAIERLAAARLAAAEARDAVAKTRFDPASVDAFARQEAALPALLADFFNAADVAPELKSLATYHALRQEFATIARSISISIETYNAAVRNLDSACCRFPAKFMCRLLAFKPARPL
ncbi:MAG TPA: LemA family protein, partial [Verrucomicrobiae bacterium]|nr:LemA family protein [Verrucomicrobiae bacterium]